jgi:imidazole glycerol-phosphate synthase subunit HisF
VAFGRLGVKRVRVIPVLLLKNGDLVKTVQFKNPTYIGDPINAVRIFNDKRVDELILLDIGANRSAERSEELLSEIASEAFMPVAFGGGITNLAQVEKVLRLGVEKVVINSAAAEDPELITAIARQFGSQSVVVSIDVRPKRFGSCRVFTNGGRKSTGRDPVAHAKRVADAGAGEILITSIAHEGTGRGYDLKLIRAVADAVSVPVIANGGASGVADFAVAVRTGHASAVAASSMFVFQGTHRAVLISFPDETLLKQELYSIAN